MHARHDYLHDSGIVRSSLSAAWTAIIEQATHKLRSSHYLPLRNVSCSYHEGALTLRGRVPTFFLKQLAQTLVRTLEGVEEVVNQVEVLPPGVADQKRPFQGDGEVTRKPR